MIISITCDNILLKTKLHKKIRHSYIFEYIYREINAKIYAAIKHNKIIIGEFNEFKKIKEIKYS